DGFWLPKSIPLDKWHAFLDSRVKKTGKLLQSKEAKIRWVKQLEKLIKECSDVPAFMDYVTAKSWANFIMHPSVKWDEVITQSNQPKPPIPRQPKDKPPTGPESPPVDVGEVRKSIHDMLNKIRKN
ncbi:hypothetical protein, partial [Snodgrassella sp. CFCC 13594]|uniref:hypothetical protein n=1 Tax=Snodgrassella sp. CFCC 13594 TaxID=1775559 RepID=UPI000AC26499